MSISQKFLPYWIVARNAFAADMEYRVNYFILILSSVITVAMEIAIFRQIFSGRDEAGGLHKDQVLSFIVLGILIRSGCQLWTMISEAVDQIRDGSFRKFLLQPLSYPLYFHAQVVGPKVLTWILSALTVLILSRSSGFEALLPRQNLWPFLVALTISYLLVWQMYLSIVYLGFWIEESHFLTVAFNLGMGVFSGTTIPLKWLPEILQRILRASPLVIVGDFPIRAGLQDAMAQREWQQLALTGTLWFAIFIAGNALLKQRAFKAYEAYGG